MFSGGLAADRVSLVVPTYTPILTHGMEVGSGEPTGWWETFTARPHGFTTDEANDGSRSVYVDFRDGNNFFAGWTNLSASATVGDTIWYRAYFYFPDTLSLSSGGFIDYSGWGKFLMLSPNNHASPRMYTQLPSPLQKNYGDSGFEGTDLRVDSDGMGTGNLTHGALPRDQWFALQMAWNIQTSGNGGWVRLWVDDTYVGQVTTQVSAGYTVQTWGLGDYWNGEAWIQGSSTARFYLDSVVITKETPNTTDSGGRPFIHPQHFLI
jgi:hypothetical protein